jgi:uncharacterized membrane protein YbhN (UPF0104 family)
MSEGSVIGGLSTWWHMARRLVGPILSMLALTAVVWWALHQRAPKLPTDLAGLLLLAMALAVYAFVTVLRGARWHAILRRAGVRVSMVDTQALIVVGYMGNTVLPVRGGELLRVVLLGRRTDSSRVMIAGTIVAERLLDILALLLMVVLLASITVTGSPSTSEISLTAAVSLLVLALALLSARWLGRSGRLRGLGGHMASLTLASRNLLCVQGLMLALLTGVIWVGEGCVYWLVGRSLDLHLGLVQGCFLVVLASLAATIPAAPGYVGTYDAAIQLGLRTLHVQTGTAVAFGLLTRLIIFVPITLVGLILMVLRYGGLASLGRLRHVGAATRTDKPAELIEVVK